MTLDKLAGQWIVHSLGWTLLHFCWQGAIIAIVLWCVLRLMQGSSANARYVAACVALALMVLAPAVTFANLAAADYRLAHSGLLPDGSGLIFAAGNGVSADWSLARLAAALDPLVPWLLMLWMAGAALFTARLAAGFHVARSLATTAVSACSAELQERFSTLQQRLGVTKPVTLLASAVVQVPTVIGWLRPVVLIPLGCFTGLGAMQIEAILSHELAHIRRHDYLVSVVQSVVEAMLFYHPAVWWVSTELRRERECCCDDLAVAVGGNALEYARALSTLEAVRSSYPQAVLGANGGVLTMRIKRLLHRNETSTASQAAAVVVLALLGIGAVTLGSTARAEARTVPVPVAALAPVTAVAPVAAVAPKAVLRAPAVKLAAAFAAPVAPLLPAPPMQQANGPVRISGGVMAGQIESKTQPKYPAEAKAAHISGAVVLHAVIATTGDIKDLAVLSGPPELATSAIDAVRLWKYKPYLLNGQPTEVETTITVNYSFGGSGPDPDAAPHQIGGSVSAPKLVSSPVQPTYTAEAREKKISGMVLVEMVLDQQGDPTNVRVVRGIGGGLDEKAVEAVKSYKFEPAMENGHPVAVDLKVEVDFKTF